MNFFFVWLIHPYRIFLSLFSCLALPSICFATGPSRLSGEIEPLCDKGVVIERVTVGLEANKAGIQVGDILVSWSRGRGKSDIKSPFDLSWIETEQAPRGQVRIEGFRGNHRHIWLLRSYGWGVITRPNMQGGILRLYLEGQRLAHTDKLAPAFERWQQASTAAEQAGASWLASWFLLRIAQWISWAKQDDAANDAYWQATEHGRPAGPIVTADLFSQWGAWSENREDFNRAALHYEVVLAEWRRVESSTIMIAASLVDVGRTALKKGDWGRSEECFKEILAMRPKLPPRSIQIVVSLIYLGNISEDRGDLAAAETYYNDALAIEKMRPVNRVTSNLAVILSDLGTLAFERSNLADAEFNYRRALAIAEKLHPQSLIVADVLERLGDCLAERGKSAHAQKYQLRALAIREKLSSGSLLVAASLAGLGRIAGIQGNLAAATNYYQRALDIGEKLSPVPLEVANFLIGAGTLLREKKDFVGAEAHYRRALRIMDETGPGSVNHGETLAALAGVLRLQGKLDAAAELYQQALSDLEEKTVLGGDEPDRLFYRADHDRYYKEYMELLLQLKDHQLAFQVLENSRARALVEMLKRSRVMLQSKFAPDLQRQERSLQQSPGDHSRDSGAIEHEGEQSGNFDRKIGQFQMNLRQTHPDRMATDPTYADLAQPESLPVAQIQQLLDPETLLLEYSLGKESSYVWVIAADSLSVYKLAPSEKINRLALAFHRIVSTKVPAGNIGNAKQTVLSNTEAHYQTTSVELSRLVLGPVAHLISGKRLVIVSDGALHFVPFSALPGPDSPHLPLVAEHEIVNLPSVSVLAQLRKSQEGRAKALKEVAILADPVFDTKDSRVVLRAETPLKEPGSLPTAHMQEQILSKALIRSATDLNLKKDGRAYLGRLIYTRKEAEAVMALAPAGKRMAALDFNASRSLASSAALSKYRIVHFATHGLLNTRHPELSGLVFSLVDEQGRPQNGFLKLQDIYNLHLPVDLVVLSGCETGLGQPFSGEGLIGLTRGFMYAGSSRVIASLWSVSDLPTSELMAKFYKALLRDKMRPAAALRAAQIAMWKQKQWKSPYYWAAFQIQGDWQ